MCSKKVVHRPTWRDRLVEKAANIARNYPADKLDEVIQVVALASGAADQQYFKGLSEMGYNRFRREVYRKVFQVG